MKLTTYKVQKYSSIFLITIVIAIICGLKEETCLKLTWFQVMLAIHKYKILAPHQQGLLTHTMRGKKEKRKTKCTSVEEWYHERSLSENASTRLKDP